MNEDPIILKLSISHYGALLKLDLVEEKRANIARLLESAKKELARTRAQNDPGAPS